MTVWVLTYDETPVAAFTTRQLAEQAIENYTKKGNVDKERYAMYQLAVKDK
jgi:hypothetical protein